MARLSDALFAPSQADIEFIKFALRKAGLSADQIKSKSWNYYKRRVRRRVPPPKVLEREYLRVINMFAGLLDAKTGKPLFNKKAWGLHKATLRHIRKGCLSDIDAMSYYVHIRDDKYGVPIYRCIRGTSALEGFHQKIRQLIRGFNISPRYAIALLTEYIYRWNHDIDVRIIGLPSKYANFYDGPEIEEEIEITSMWDEVDKPPHPEWHSTKHVAGTGEGFALLPNFPPGYLSSDIEEEIEQLVDAFEDGTLDGAAMATDEDGEDLLASLQVLPESAAWISRQLKTKRGFGRVRTETEKEFFRANCAQFQSSMAGTEADNYHILQFGAFAQFWCEFIAEEEKEVRPKTDMTLKNAFHLQEYYKQFKKEANATLTLMDVHSENNALRRELRGPGRQPLLIPPAVAPTRPVIVVANSDAALDTQPDLDSELQDHGGTSSCRVHIQTFGGAVPEGMDGTQYRATAPVHAAAPVQATKRKRGKRCRKCGHEYSFETVQAAHHAQLGKIGASQKPAQDVCNVDPSEYEDGFPLAEGAVFPRR
jgi:hypothetical protein